MSEMTRLSGKVANLRATLLATGCGTALLATLCTTSPATASDGDADRPTVWVELGGEFTQLENGQEAYLPPFVLDSPRIPAITQSPFYTEKNAPMSWDGEAKISFEPSGTDWVFSARIRYGRNMANKSLDQRTTQKSAENTVAYGYHAYQNMTAKNVESHMVLDFSAGKDVGLGKFGSSGKSVINLGVRYAQFDSRSKVGIQYQPTNVYRTFYKLYGSFTAARKFIGVGPSLSWDASADVIGNPSKSRVSLDWGLNGAILFGRQRTDVHHQTSKVFIVNGYNRYPVTHTASSPSRSKQVIVPNLGGFAGVSWHLPNTKVSIGYRADMFFGAIDGGVDARKTYDRGFYGPFASISIGIGG
jgi:iron complex outermembrane receptor protein